MQNERMKKVRTPLLASLSLSENVYILIGNQLNTFNQWYRPKMIHMLMKNDTVSTLVTRSLYTDEGKCINILRLWYC